MKFGKVDNLDGIDFSLPEDDLSNRDILFDGNEACRIYIGATGWSMKEWKGKIYPSHAKANEFLYHYSRSFNSIEFNSSHYNLPKQENIYNWISQVPDDFRFCPKVWQQVSHRKDLGLVSGKLFQFLDSVIEFKEYLGTCFLQLPPYFGYDRLEQLKAIMKQWPEEISLAIEARHQSFYENEHFKIYLGLCREHKIIPLITDVAGRRDILHSSLATEKAMIRWVGNGLHPTDYARIDAWISRINEWIKLGVEEIYFFPHEPDNLLTPEISRYLVKPLNQIPNIITRGPHLRDGNKQLSLL